MAESGTTIISKIVGEEVATHDWIKGVVIELDMNIVLWRVETRTDDGDKTVGIRYYNQCIIPVLGPKLTTGDTMFADIQKVLWNETKGIEAMPEDTVEEQIEKNERKSKKFHTGIV